MTEQDQADTSAKRRLSIRTDHHDLPDKKVKREHDYTEDVDTDGLRTDNEQPHTGTSPKMNNSTSTFSSPTSSTDRDEAQERPSNRPIPISDGETGDHRGLQHRQHSFHQGAESDRTSSSVAALSISSSNNQRRLQPSTSNSTGTSRQSSPPPNFNLSSGQPLVNPPPKTQAAFVGKLYSMLEDEEIARTGLLYWSGEGKTFTCPNPTEFSKVVLPRYFKHNNWQSFVRQLNMYSFNKVNDIYSSSTDPQSWEFRHNLFRRGEPHLLPSIKRKSSRPSIQDGMPSLASPTDESVPDMPKPVAGWMRDPYRVASSPLAQQIGIYPYADGAMSSRKDDSRPPSRSGMWDRQPRMLPPPDHQAPVRFHPDPNRAPLNGPPLNGQRYHPPGYPESPIYGQSPMIDGLMAQVSILEERVQKLTDILNTDRIEHVRSNLDFTSYLLQMVGWAAKDQNTPEMRALQDTLSRQNVDMRQKYEAFMASDALAIMASGGGGRDRDSSSREKDPGRGSRFGFEGPPPFPSHRSGHTPAPDFRLPQTSQSATSSVPTHHSTPRTSPVATIYSDAHLIRPSLSDCSRESYSYPPTQGLGFHAGPVSISRSSSASMIDPPPFGSASIPPLPMAFRPMLPDEREQRDADRRQRDKEREREREIDRSLSLARRENVGGWEEPHVTEKSRKAKTGLKNLLN